MEAAPEAATASAAAPEAVPSIAGGLPVKLRGSSICAGDCSTIIKQLGSGFTASPLQPNDPAMLLLDYRSDSSSGTAADVAVTLGRVCGRRFLACCRIKMCWMAPYQASSIADLPAHCQFLLMELHAEAAQTTGPSGQQQQQQQEAYGCSYAVVLPLLPDDCKATLQPVSGQGPGSNLVQLRLDSGNPDVQRSSWQAALLVAAGTDPFTLVDSAVAAAAAITCTVGAAKPRWQKQLPDSARALGWCTWDAFYRSVSAKGVAAGLESFRDAGLQPRWIIIDDGWQRTGLGGTAADAAAGAADDQDLQQSHVQHHQAGRQSTARDQSAVNSGSSNRSGWGGSLWWLSRQLKRAAARLERLLLQAVSAVADRLNWWSVLLAGLRSPLSGLLVRLLKGYNTATSEHSKRLLSNEFNAKFMNLTIGPVPATNSTAAAADVARVIASLKQQYGVTIYAWHAMLGYWSGVSAGAVAALPPLAAAATSAAAGAAEAAGPAAATSADRPEAGDDEAGVGSNSSSSSRRVEPVAAAVVLPRVTPAMSDLEPPCNWSQLVLGGLGLPSDPDHFLQQLHSYLAALGVQGVKVDVQNQLELAGAASGQRGGQALGRAWHAALEASVARHFPGNNIINCMCHNTNNLFRMSESALARVSDDFYPQLPASHTTHVAVCAYNSLFFGALVQPDWDMFHSLHPRALLHATARMISGGPVYVSDKPGRHDSDLLARLALPGGHLLQPLLPGRPCLDCLFVDPCRDGVSVLKVWSRNACGGVVALFNLQGSGWCRRRLKYVTHNHSPAALTAVTSPADVHGLQQCLPCGSSASAATGAAGLADAARAVAGVTAQLQHTGSYLLFRDSTGSLERVDGLSEGVSVELQPSGSDVVTVAPVLQLQDSATAGNSSSAIKLAVVGLTNMLNPGGAVQQISAVPAAKSRAANMVASGSAGSSRSSSGSWVLATDEEVAAAAVAVQLLGCGQMLVFCSCRPAAALLDGVELEFEYDGDSCHLVVQVPPPPADRASAPDGLSSSLLQHQLDLVWF